MIGGTKTKDLDLRKAINSYRNKTANPGGMRFSSLQSINESPIKEPDESNFQTKTILKSQVSVIPKDRMYMNSKNIKPTLE